MVNNDPEYGKLRKLLKEGCKQKNYAREIKRVLKYDGSNVRVQGFDFIEQ